MNARGIPTAAYQVLHLLPEVGYPLARSNGEGTQGGVPPLAYPCQVPPQPGLTWGTRGGVPPSGSPHRGTSLPRSDRGTQGGVSPVRYPSLPQPGLMGVPEVGYPSQVQQPLDLARVPPPRRCGLTIKVKLLPPSRTTYAVGKNISQVWNCSALFSYLDQFFQ